MSQHSFHVIIIGGGLGGLCLAQGLKKAGISVAIYERDRTRNERSQGYRIHIKAMGNHALHDCLPSHLFEAYLQTSGSPENAGMLIRDEQLNQLIAFPVDASKQANPLESSRSVSRITLRQVLLTELEGILHFDKFYSHYQENADGSVTAFFEDGTSATGDLLVGADGGNSRVRHQFLPHAQRNETGTVDIVGKVILTPEINRLLAAHQLHRPNIILGPRGRALFSAVHDLSSKAGSRTQGKIGANDEALLAEESTLFENTNDYYFWAFMAREKNYPVSEDLQHASKDKLLQIAQNMMADWHPTIQHLLDMTAVDTIMLTPLRIATQVAPWESQNLTLLGDAIHSMPPTRGIGGNIALRDAQLLCQKLISVARQEKNMPEALKEYVTEMLSYSFAAVKSSKQSLDLIVMENTPGRALAKTALRSYKLLASHDLSA
ncbi:FAD-dependent monooxygenase [Ktedonosporobacter rubrisoli]|uniref:FAD-dependent monooxygenase n=1 Tax=Ktedonosporobacter rubrisoli TaxID=2509675 RepID=A0A4P6JIE0_KTERU|nr:FAD-dependent monooxygenase [Ktedonosporobacter rubrisoli]QBD74672.1 FAD-dependent monooxygenase [Ktedonosporobacter rubrisoli]